MLEGVLKNFPEKETLKQGVASIHHLVMTKGMAEMQHLRRIVNNGEWYEDIDPGEYIQLAVNGELMMSDTQMEKYTNSEFVRMARGEVMIAGLGIGMVLENLVDKAKEGIVTRIVVYEKYQDVIDLVAHRYLDRLPLEVRCKDILKYQPPKEEKYDTMYFDIWPTICADNLEEIKMLHYRWRSHKKTKLAWMDSWMANKLRDMRRRELQKAKHYGWDR